jgi:hypothetical protein
MIVSFQRDILPSAVSRDDFREIAYQAVMSKADAANCRATFRRLLGSDLPTRYHVRQRLPEDFAGIMKEAGMNIHSPFLLQGVDPETDAQMTRNWADWARQVGHSPTAAEVQAEATTISERYAAKLIEVPR